MPRPTNFFRTLATAKVHYDRSTEPGKGYGTRGQRWTFYCTTSVESKLRACFNDLWDMCPLGAANFILSAGTWVDKPGAHGLGRAFDLDGILWDGKTFVALNYPFEPRFYLSVESIFRKRFGTVLNYQYDHAHRDHLHIDDTSPVGFSPSSRSRVLFLQMVLTHVYGMPVIVDGIVGPQTNGATRVLLVNEGFATPGEVSTDAKLFDVLNREWLGFLDMTTIEGFAHVGPIDLTPLDLLQSLYVTIQDELGGSQSRKRIETAVTTFANHSDTEEFLNEYR